MRPLYHHRPKITTRHSDILGETKVARYELFENVEHRLWLGLVAGFVEARVVCVEVPKGLFFVLQSLLLGSRNYSLSFFESADSCGLVLLSLYLMQDTVEILLIKDLVLVFP